MSTECEIKLTGAQAADLLRILEQGIETGLGAPAIIPVLREALRRQPEPEKLMTLTVYDAPAHDVFAAVSASGHPCTLSFAA